MLCSRLKLCSTTVRRLHLLIAWRLGDANRRLFTMLEPCPEPDVMSDVAGNVAVCLSVRGTSIRMPWT
ncbi:hypothetical protein RESH_06199 [Rhodopirellula europaea SH398]|uniref:Uncharacterized protein n=1 Tax=Rhodopirellula europaea SH398 TaxID=1263868 RepID=M5S6M7_9BACT|nr:hypothetical protein RESH_06199 [Rhodopirellula europaea SH398]